MDLSLATFERHVRAMLKVFCCVKNVFASIESLWQLLNHRRNCLYSKCTIFICSLLWFFLRSIGITKRCQKQKIVCEKGRKQTKQCGEKRHRTIYFYRWGKWIHHQQKFLLKLSILLLCVFFSVMGNCLFAYGRKLGELCRRDADCESGLICDVSALSGASVCRAPMAIAKQYAEDCVTSSDCDITRYVFYLQRRKKQEISLIK